MDICETKETTFKGLKLVVDLGQEDARDLDFLCEIMDDSAEEIVKTLIRCKAIEVRDLLIKRAKKELGNG